MTDRPTGEGVWAGNWTSFVSEKKVPESKKYWVLATWKEDSQDHSCRYPVVATSSEAAVRYVEDFERCSPHPLFSDDVDFQVLPLDLVPREQLEYLLRTDREASIQ